MNTNPIEFKPGQCAVYTNGTGTTRSVTIYKVDENVVRIQWLAKRNSLARLPLSHAAAQKALVLFLPGEKFMVLESPEVFRAQRNADPLGEAVREQLFGGAK